MSELLHPLEQARRALEMSMTDLWWRYFAVGGMASEMEIEAMLFGALVASDLEWDLLAVALNERYSELGDDHPIPYSDDQPDPDAPIHP